MKNTKCYICGNDTYKLPINKKYSYMLCKNCGHGSLDPWNMKLSQKKYFQKKYFDNLSQPVVNPVLKRLYAIRLFKSPAGFTLDQAGNRKSVTDIGCGNGEYLYELQQHGWNVGGIDISKESVARVKKLLGSKNIHVNTLKHPLDKKSDILSFWHVLEHVPDPKIYLKNAFKSCKKNGLVIGEVPNVSTPWLKTFKQNYSWLMIPEHIHYFSPDSLKLVLTNAGFKSVKICSPPRCLLNFSNSLANCASSEQYKSFIRIASAPLSIMLTILLALLKRGEVLRFVAKK